MRTNAIRNCRISTTGPNNFLHYSTQSRQRRRIIAERNTDVNAFISVSHEHLETPTDLLPLSGVTVAVKDNIVTKFMPTTCSSAILKNFTSPFNATVVKLLQDAGAVIIGKTNCDEFGMGSLNVHSIHGPVVNPVDTSEQRSAGGSSGGSAAAVAAGMCDAALGTDTGGSVRLPASYCGIVGLKPSYGLISRWGVVSYADSLDCVGVMASNVDTTKRIFDRISSYDSFDPTAAPPSVREQVHTEISERLVSSNSMLTGLRIGVPQEYFPAELSPEIIEIIRNVLRHLKLHGATIVPVSLPSTSFALSSYYVLASAEASSNFARFDGIQFGSHVPPPQGTDLTKISNVYAHTRSAGFGTEVQKRILLGTYALSADAFDNYFLQAQRVRQLIQDDYDRVFNIPNYFSDAYSSNKVARSTDSPRIDVLLHPSAIRTAPLLSENNVGPKSELSTYVQDIFTVPASLAGLPALSMPVRRGRHVGQRSEVRLPISFSLVGQWGTDEMVLAVGKAIEDLDWHDSSHY